MAPQAYADVNGEDKALFPAFRRFVGQVRAGWITFVVVTTFVVNIATNLVVNGWLIAPAKSTDLSEVKTVLVRLESATTMLASSNMELAKSAVELKTAVGALKDQLSSMDRKIDVLIGRPGQQRPVIVKRTSLF
jgi:hypothetical protein